MAVVNCYLRLHSLTTSQVATLRKMLFSNPRIARNIVAAAGIAISYVRSW
jgi:hypothetical protein